MSARRERRTSSTPVAATAISGIFSHGQSLTDRPPVPVSVLRVVPASAPSAPLHFLIIFDDAPIFFHYDKKIAAHLQKELSDLIIIISDLMGMRIRRY